MRAMFFIVLFLATQSVSFSQKVKIPAKNYPSLLWEISGNGLSKPSYLFGTMHVSSKMVFHLSDSFYLGIRNADVVALETNMGTWQEDFSRYEMDDYSNYLNRYRSGYGSPSDYLSINTLQYPSYEKIIELALYSNPSIINNFLYRSYSERSSDFEEDTYLDLHIYQTGKKWGKKVLGVEDFDQSMQLMKEAYLDAAKEKNNRQRGNDYDADLSYAHLEDAYRTGNLDLLDTINKVNSVSAAFDEKFLYKRNEIQARSMDSIMKSNSRLFVGVGAAHLPGQRGVIEILRGMGYKLRPIKMSERDSHHKEEVEKIRVPVQFSPYHSADGFYSVSLPGKLYDFSGSMGLAQQNQFADMSNGSYYMVTRINTNSLLWGHNESVVLRKIDSLVYENVPGKILSKQAITKNGYKGYEVSNRTRRGDYQRYNIFVTPYEILLFKMSGNGEYVKDGKEADQFFNSIELRDYQTHWNKWSPAFGGFEVDMPHEPVVIHEGNWQFMASDATEGTAYEIIRTDIHNYEFVEEDSFDLALMEESFGSSDFIEKQLSRKQTRRNGYAALDAKYRYKDGSVALVTFLINGSHYYTLVAHGKKEVPRMNRFVQSFAIRSFEYGTPVSKTDTSLYFTVNTPVPLQKERKISMMPEGLGRYGGYGGDDDSFLEDRGVYKNRLVESDSTGEKIYVSFYKPSRYYYDSDSSAAIDTAFFKTEKMKWTFRQRKDYKNSDNWKVLEYVIGDPKSSRYVQGKYFAKDGVGYRLETEGDTITKQSSFISGFFETFKPSDTVKGTNIKEKKTALFFQDFFSKDTMLRKRAIKNVHLLEFDSTDYSQLKKAIASLNWSDKKYLDIKKSFLWQLAAIPTKEASDYLKQVYTTAGDTIEMQHTALNILMAQKTAYSYGVFRDIMVTDPPVLDISMNEDSYSSRISTNYLDYTSMITAPRMDGSDYSRNSFFEGLTDSLQLTATIFKDLLPLLSINDYEQPMMELMSTLIDSSLIAAKDFEQYQSKFLIEAKQLLKKQVISEKNKSINKAQKDEDETDVVYGRDDEDNDTGNSQLSLYANLLMPFWDKSAAVQQLTGQLLSSNDKRLKYNTMMLLLRNSKPVPDTMTRYFAAMDEYRYELYDDLRDNKLLSRFPAAWQTQVLIAKSKLLQSGRSYDRPDTIVYLDKLPFQYKDRNGYILFFKYRQKKDDNTWKLATAGIVPSDPKQVDYTPLADYREEMDYDFTELTGKKIEADEPVKEQLKKLVKKLKYSKRNSAAQFYNDEDRGDMDFMRGMMIRD